MTWRRVLVAFALVASVASLAEAQSQIAAWRDLPNGPMRFVKSQFGVDPDEWQREALIAFANPHPDSRRISLQACAGPGKSAVMAWCAWYFMATQASRAPSGVGFDHPNGFVTGITGQNLSANFWKEMAKWQARSAYLRSAFEWRALRIAAIDHPSTWFLERRNWPKTGSADEQGATLSGLHGRNVAAFIDESGAIPSTVLRAAEQALADGPRFGKIMQAGNPISLEGMLHEAATKLRDQWIVIRITGDPDDPKRSPRINIEWARKQILTYGRDNPWVKSYILGQFPPNSINALLGIEEVEAAMARELDPEEYTWAQKRIGVDVARFGDDRSVIFARQGLNARIAKNNPVILREADTVKIADRVAFANSRFSPEIILVDDTGHWGHGVIDNLQKWELPAVGVIFSDPAINGRYANRRAEMWIQMANAIKAGTALPNLPALVQELTAVTFTFNNNGKLVLEEKKQMKARLGVSPDIADALALTYSIPEMAGDVLEKLKGEGAGVRAAIEADPFAAAQALHAPGGGGRAAMDHDPFKRED